MLLRKKLKSAIESMLFVWGEPLSIEAMAETLEMSQNDVYDLCRELQDEYSRERRGIVMREVNKSFQFVTREENAVFVEKLCTPVRTRRLSQAALEVLAIIAYKQPVTKGEIDAIRGIKCERVIEGLAAKGLIEVIGKSNAVGRPSLYGTTDMFLKNFGFTSLSELPEIEDIEYVISTEADDDESGGEVISDFGQGKEYINED